MLSDGCIALQSVKLAFSEMFKRHDEEEHGGAGCAEGTVSVDAFKSVLSELEANFNMNFMSSGATKCVAEADANDTPIDYNAFLDEELLTPRVEEPL